MANSNRLPSGNNNRTSFLVEDEESKLPRAFYDDIKLYWKDWKMADKRTYKEIAASIETHVAYINNHLGNIDKHLEKINTTNLGQEVKIGRNKDRIDLGYKIGGGLILLLAGGITAILINLLGYF